MKPVIQSTRQYWILLLSAFSIAAGAQPTPRIAVVNGARVMHESTLAQQEKTRTEAMFDSKLEELKQQIEQVNRQATQLKLESNAASESQQKRNALAERQLTSKAKELQRRKWALMQERSVALLQSAQRVTELAKSAIKRIANEQKIDIVFAEAIYSNPVYDITDKVIEYINRGEASH